ncbi:DUF5908 family protein [Mucilaginibacter sp. cycad4]|uniref:DUF5908 family protein n=1 Tax=Mucilaginibacter sp. cycad4 TaxID=3342096 RepID=UPI002AAAD71D|nr:DUF5908 family protein [Mucilaginibacter gossypii]WPV01746.1 DUF5908 family protein [Mucilaginibacter gossypii]
MAVEIRELVIRATIIRDEGEMTPAPAISATEHALLVEECVKEVIRIIENNKKR